MKNGLNKTYIVYRHHSKTTKLSYVGLTYKSLNERFNDHVRQALRGDGWKFHEAIRNYGKNDFESEILCECQSLEEAKNKEKHYIEYYDSYHNGYNSNSGGWGGYERSLEIKEKLSNSLKKSYEEGKLISPFSKKEIHERCIKTRSENGSNIFSTRNPMKDKKTALQIASKRSGKSHYTSNKYTYEVHDNDGNIKKFLECSISEIISYYNIPLATFNKYTNSSLTPSRGPFKGFKIFRYENSKN